MTKKELKDSYKEMKFQMGVLQIRNTTNGKVFIEGSVNVNALWNRYRLQLNLGSHPNALLQKDWNTLGETSFVYEVIAEVAHDEEKELDYKKEVKALAELLLEELEPFEEKGYHSRKKLNKQVTV